MTPQQFWEDDPDDLWAYWEAYQQKQKEMAEFENVKAFNQGQYFLCALAQCLQFTKNPKKIYPKEPFPLNSGKKDKITKQEYEEVRRAQLQQMVKKFNSKK